MDADSTSRTSVNLYQTTRRNILESSYFNNNIISSSDLCLHQVGSYQCVYNRDGVCVSRCVLSVNTTKSLKTHVYFDRKGVNQK
jgi:hypothetical protein